MTEILGISIGLAEFLVICGVGLLISLARGWKILPLSKGIVFLIAIGLMGAGAYQAGWLSGELPDRDTGSDTGRITEGLNAMFYAKDKESLSAISGLTFKLYEGKVELKDVQANKVTPYRVADAVTASDGKAMFSNLDAGSYTLVFQGNEAAFDGTDYMGSAISVELTGLKETLNTRDQWFNPSNVYLKKIGDVYYNISSTGTSLSGGTNTNATVTESGSSGTVVSVTVKCNTDQAWLTDQGYFNRIYLSTEYTGSENTETTLANCRLGTSSTGTIISKDLSGSYYIEIKSSIMKNTTLNKNDVFNFDLWVPDLGEVTSTADKLKIWFKHTLVSQDPSGLIILQDTGLNIEITCEDNS